MAQLVSSKDLDKKKWNELVQSDCNATIFNHSYYIDSLAENWCLYCDEELSYGIIVPFKRIINQKIVYTPFFFRYSDLVGDKSKFSEDDFILCLKENFESGSLSLSFEVKWVNSISRDFQLIKENKTKSLAKRQLKKISQYNLKVEEDNSKHEALFQLIFNQLSEKIRLYRKKSNRIKFLKLIEELKVNNNLITLIVYQDQKMVGGVFAMASHSRLIYLKGASVPELKEEGLMYLLINELIQKSIKEKLLFDFGGSSVENVRFFNTRFNGIDQSYYVYTWENNPTWFKLIKNARKWIKK